MRLRTDRASDEPTRRKIKDFQKVYRFPYPFIYQKPGKGTPFRRSASLPVQAIIGSIPRKRHSRSSSGCGAVTKDAIVTGSTILSPCSSSLKLKKGDCRNYEILCSRCLTTPQTTMDALQALRKCKCKNGRKEYDIVQQVKVSMSVQNNLLLHDFHYKLTTEMSS